MGYASVWKVLDEMIADFRRKRVKVTSEIASSMKIVKSMIEIMLNNPKNGQDLQKIEEYLNKTQICLVLEAEKHFGPKYADEWLTRIDKASRKMPDEEEEKKRRFVPGLPRQQSWIRIAPSADLPLQELMILAREHRLSYRKQEKNIMLVWGSKEDVKDFVKKIATEHKQKSGKKH